MMAVIESSVSTNKAVVQSTNQSSNNKPTTKYGGGCGPVFVFGIDIDDELWDASPSPKDCPFSRPKMNQMKPLIIAADETSKVATAVNSVVSLTAPSDSTSSSGSALFTNDYSSNGKKHIVESNSLSGLLSATEPSSGGACDDGEDDQVAAELLPFKLQHDPLGLLLFGLSD